MRRHTSKMHYKEDDLVGLCIYGEITVYVKQCNESVSGACQLDHINLDCATVKSNWPHILIVISYCGH